MRCLRCSALKPSRAKIPRRWGLIGHPCRPFFCAKMSHKWASQPSCIMVRSMAVTKRNDQLKGHTMLPKRPIVQCRNCGGPMKKGNLSKGFVNNVVTFMLYFCLGVIIFIFIPVIGWVLGPMICLASPFVGGVTKVWKCRACPFTMPRA